MTAFPHSSLKTRAKNQRTLHLAIFKVLKAALTTRRRPIKLPHSRRTVKNPSPMNLNKAKGQKRMSLNVWTRRLELPPRKTKILTMNRKSHGIRLQRKRRLSKKWEIFSKNGIGSGNRS
jgi:hypothetical protein